MLRSDEGEDDVFFDSMDHLSCEESVRAKEELGCGKLDYEIWRNEPRSVRERRESFLRGMGFVEFVPEHDKAFGDPPEMVELGRITECSGAVSSSSVSSINCTEENSVCSGREGDVGANCMVDALNQQQSEKQNIDFEGETRGLLPSAQEFECNEGQACVEGCKNLGMDKKTRSWWKRFISKRKGRDAASASQVSKQTSETPKINQMKVRQNKKRCMEFTALCIGQEIQAHKGFIWTMKFSPDGQYLASGGEDGVVRIWCVTSTDASCKYLTSEGNFGCEVKDGKSSFGRKKPSYAPVVIPDKIFQIEESPLQEFHGHASDVLDLAWSKSNSLLSSSMDKTVRLWQVGHDECLNVFRHNNYVTCIQFNPVDDNYFISGSIDGKVRIWGVSERRVVDWADVRDVITAICYQPDGKGFIVGSVTGTCCFYNASGNHLQLDAKVNFHGRKKTSGNKITGIQFSQEESQKVMITSEDSKLRILDGIDVVYKYKGLRKSGSQMSASFTSTGRHIVSVGEDSRVYVWNYDGFCSQSSKQMKSVQSCEHFFFEGVSVAIPWSDTGAEKKGLGSDSLRQSPPTQDHLEAASWIRDSERFSLGNWFSMDGSCRGGATWPEEKLPLWGAPEHDHHHHDHQQQQQHNDVQNHNHLALSEAWGLVIATAGWDGTIRTFHNYGLPVRL